MSDTPAPRTRGTPWHVALEPLVVEFVVKPLLVKILQDGVTSYTDLAEKFNALIDAENPPSISAGTISKWTKMAKLDHVLKPRSIYKLENIAPGPAPQDVAGVIRGLPKESEQNPEDSPEGDDSDDLPPVEQFFSHVEPSLDGEPEDRPDRPHMIRHQ